MKLVKKSALRSAQLPEPGFISKLIKSLEPIFSFMEETTPENNTVRMVSASQQKAKLKSHSTKSTVQEADKTQSDNQHNPHKKPNLLYKTRKNNAPKRLRSKAKNKDYKHRNNPRR